MMIFNLFKAPLSDTVVNVALFGFSVLSVGYFGCLRHLSIKREKLLASPFHNPIPKQPHVTLAHPELKPRVIIVGDIHGCLHEFKSLLVACNYEPALTSVILVGDLVNKGPYSAQVVKFAREIGAYSVRGNHDDFALQYALRENRGPLPTKLSYIDELSRDDIEWMKEMPYTISLPSYNSVIVHAGLLPDRNIDEQCVKDMYLMRNIVTTDDGSLSGSDRSNEGVPWVDLWKKPIKVYFGHDAKRGLQKTEHAWGLDSGCVYGRKLSGIILPEEKLVQIDALEIYEAIKNKDKE